jgi:rod shape-determining protein MreD
MLAAVGLIALMVQGALSTIIPPPWCPDLALIAVVCMGLRWRGLAGGLVLAASLGFAADLLSGSLMGQHGLLRLFVFVAAFFAGRQLNLKGSLPLALFVGVVTLVYGLLLYLVSDFFIGGAGATWRFAIELTQHAIINALVAPRIFSVVTRASVWSGDDDTASRVLHIDSRRRPA